MSEIFVESLFTYPVKSLPPVPQPEVAITSNGLAGDRVIALAGVGREGDIAPRLTLRECPGLTQITPSYVAGGIVLNAQGHDALRLPTDPQEGRTVTVKSFGGPITGIHAGEEAAQWLSGVVERDAQVLIVPDADTYHRTIKPEDRHHEAAELTGRATDGYPIHIVSLASLRSLNAARKEAGLEPIDIGRFRANVALDGEDLEPFAENSWEKLVMEGADGKPIELIGLRACERCVAVEVNPETGEKDEQQVLRSILDYQKTRGDVARKPVFGIWARPSQLAIGGVLRVGQRVRAVTRP